MKPGRNAVLLLFGLLSALSAAAQGVLPRTEILFGSCLHQRRPFPILVTMGDNISADTFNPQIMNREYAELAANRVYQRLLTTWDDHDYGAQDAGACSTRAAAADRFQLPGDTPFESGWEGWANFPAEKRRLLTLLGRLHVTGVILLSGDRHFAEISRLEREGAYPLFEVTSSALNLRFPATRLNPNQFRLRVSDLHGRVRLELKLSLADLGDS